MSTAQHEQEIEQKQEKDQEKSNEVKDVEMNSKEDEIGSDEEELYTSPLNESSPTEPTSSEKSTPSKKFKTVFRSSTERYMSEVPHPKKEHLASEVLFNETGKIDLEKLTEHLFHEGRLSPEDVIRLIEQASEIFATEPNLLSVPAPVTVCGDIHGQFYDLMKLFEIGGDPASTTYIFLGDYVDRGCFSMECIILLYSYKINYPDTFFMIRGNHECRHLTEYFTFKEECKKKYSLEVYDVIMDSFDTLPLGVVMNDQFLCIHGGLSPDIQTLDDIMSIDRFREPPQNGAMCDILWSDPMEDFSVREIELFHFNELRSCSFVFSYRAACNFLEQNNLLSIIRAHEAQDSGYKMHRKSKETGFPSVITLFSAPNYLDAYNNKGAILRYEDNIMNIRQFTHSPHPYWLPNFMNVFAWSLPFVVEKVAEMLLVIMKSSGQDDEDPQQGEVMSIERKKKIRTKVLLVSKFMLMYSTLRNEHESILLLKGLSGSNKIPRGLLTAGPAAIKEAIGNFLRAKEIDSTNEMRPASPIPLRSPSGRIGELKRRNSLLFMSGEFPKVVGSVSNESLRPTIIQHEDAPPQES
eukprot:TRINITY_DN12661_c0_g1_i1.p1 TRINITY_DN12661_c0_g1~~TRINITY_DN12661_c0_g1_i1.p1  ORF type:complete len:580 (+),score=109.00 TRINITY_DN12661_c0_g1_i1:53-1792(+)